MQTPETDRAFDNLVAGLTRLRGDYAAPEPTIEARKVLAFAQVHYLAEMLIRDPGTEQAFDRQVAKIVQEAATQAQNRAVEFERTRAALALERAERRRNSLLGRIKAVFGIQP